MKTAGQINLKVSFTASQFAWCLALNEPPGWYDMAFRLGQETHQILFEFQQTY